MADPISSEGLHSTDCAHLQRCCRQLPEDVQRRLPPSDLRVRLHERRILKHIKCQSIVLHRLHRCCCSGPPESPRRHPDHLRVRLGPQLDGALPGHVEDPKSGKTFPGQIQSLRPALCIVVGCANSDSCFEVNPVGFHGPPRHLDDDCEGRLPLRAFLASTEPFSAQHDAPHLGIAQQAERPGPLAALATSGDGNAEWAAP
mmetsp:Transcript_5605/g.21180  ORF Transcript_5605/g.21180 Transcript_5605/m.21180 type:complete len:201 (-) Transcript_5605:1186-1788(-)